MKSLPNLLQRTLKSEDKRAPFDPISLLNIGILSSIKTKERQDSKARNSQPKVVAGSPIPKLFL